MTYQWPHHNLDVAQNFFVDCSDFLKRYDVTYEHFFDIKSRRLKCFSDLRNAYECVLKCAHAYSMPREERREEIINGVERFSHKISALETALPESTRNSLPLKLHGNVLDTLPVGLRYALDGYDFINAKSEIYYQTVGSDHWIDNFRAYVGEMHDAMDDLLDKHSDVVSGSDMSFEAVRTIKFNKYRK